jgi:hypothetical protein
LKFAYRSGLVGGGNYHILEKVNRKNYIGKKLSFGQGKPGFEEGGPAGAGGHFVFYGITIVILRL